ncbi:hypothetical protein BCR34DRAFT_587144 [Clohesyomyces aquaticus]|uniref:Uncharacterized protein n=1 Tax=Clohesyomyces aquaticus TaxID=1231657 RepID=A0A1Y1ZQP4_9PLEO|nr:hypothetical protein BCR34DRAFT_587144 [Clohesyomyces aquaticus]
MSAATTPHRMQASAPQSPAKSPSRRVLGDLPVKAINTPSKHTSHRSPGGDMKHQTSPLKQVPSLSPHLLSKSEILAPPAGFRAGRKRTIYEVEGVENVGNTTTGCGGRAGGFLGTGTPVTAAALQVHTGTNPSIQMLDDEELSPTEPDTEPEDEPPVSQDTTTSKESFSCFVNFEACDNQLPSSQSAPHPTAKEEAESKLKTKLLAAKLRTCLRGALYKVNTKQIETPWSEIISTTSASTSSSPNDTHTTTSTSRVLTSSQTDPTTTRSHSQSIPSITLSPARRSPATHIVANIDPSSHFPKLSSGPILKPTSYSSRMIYSNSHDEQEPPSSPPVPTVVSPQQLMSPIRTQSQYRTPVAKKIRVDEDVDMGEGEEEVERLDRLREMRFEDGELTSSVVKGHAAKGLLELMSGRR